MSSQRPYVEDLAEANLRLRRERIILLRRVVCLCRYIPLLLDVVGYRPDPEFVEITGCRLLVVFPFIPELIVFLCRDDKSVEVGLKSVKKTYRGDRGIERVRYLEDVYQALGRKHVPYVDRLIHSVGATVYLEPKGIALRPRNEKELLESLVCVLQALEVLYVIPKLTLLFQAFAGPPPRAAIVS
jgi:hypothetical protein